VPSVIAFSARKGDLIIVAEDLTDANNALAPTNKSASGLCQLTRIPGIGEVGYEPTPVMVNPDRVAYIMERIQM
jgi:hypothetical protein